MSNKRKRRKREVPASIRALQEQNTTTADEPAPKREAPRTRGQFQDAEAVIKADMRAYDFIKEWWKARQRGDFAFIYELSTADGPLREHFGDPEEFPEVCRRKMRPVRGIEVGELRRIRFEGADEAYVFQVQGHDERERRTYVAERFRLLQTEKGWRVHEVDRVELEKDVPVTEVGMDHFGAAELPQWFVAQRSAAD